MKTTVAVQVAFLAAIAGCGREPAGRGAPLPPPVFGRGQRTVTAPEMSGPGAGFSSRTSERVVVGPGGGPGIPEPIRAKVIAPRPDAKLVMLSVGSDDGVKKGYRFTVYRNDQYIGKVEVVKVFNDMCSAKVLKPWTKGRIREGDEVATRVYY